MRNLIHLSDLHFDRVEPALVEGLIKEIQKIRPHLVVISGDLTQRARPYQFRMAADFLKQIPFPQLIVPGNHDVPLYNVFSRFLSPFRSYQKHISPNLEPVFEDEELIVRGICTAQSFTIASGKLRASSLDGFQTYLLNRAREKTRVIVSHHPLEVGRLLSLEPDILLAGHLHLGSAISSTHLKIAPHRSLILIQGGTATSTRHRDAEGNSFNVVMIDKTSLKVKIHLWSSEKGGFFEKESLLFSLQETGWALSA